ncbi:MAG TPA: efflux transporter outer membrane subunit [Polyangia bacterium]|nr:efflux transporter outer membrane subunit [Polyangia bacterium]
MSRAPVFLGLAIAGCAVGPDFKHPETAVAASWTSGDARLAPQTADSQWWKSFNDPALDHLVDLAYRQNLPLQIAGLRIVEARAQFGVATGMQFPQKQQVSADLTAIGLTKPISDITMFPRNLLSYQAGFDAAWELDFWGKYRRGVEAEGATLLGSVADYQSALVSLSAEVARTYVAIRTSEVLIRLAQENAKVQEGGLDIAQSRFKNGATSELDPTQATTQLESTRATIPQIQISLSQQRNALATLLGQPSGTIEALLGGPQEIPKPPAKVAVGVPAEMLRRRPDIRSAELAAAAQCARIGVAKAELYPSFSLLGTIGLRALNKGPGSHNLFTTDAINYNAGPSISWPILNYGRLTNSVRVQDARFQQALVAYRDTVLRAAQEVEDALAGFLNAQQAMVFEQNAVTSAKRSVELALVAYREGATDFQRVLDAQRSLLQEQNALAQTTSSVATNLVALYKSLGGGWEPREGQPVVPVETQEEMKQRTWWGEVLSKPRSPETANTPPAGKQ